MTHCIGRSYAASAVQGSCYLFHVEYAGEQASVQVSRAGEVVQSYGPKDTLNAASRYGRWHLTRWGKALRTTFSAGTTLELPRAVPPVPGGDLVDDPFAEHPF